MILLQELVSHTIKTIKACKKFETFEENLGILKDLTKKLSIDYLGIKPSLTISPITSKTLRAPVMYTEVCRNEYFSIGVFVLKPGSRMPMHNHPNMHGILKVNQYYYNF